MAPAEAVRVLPPQATMTLTGLPRHSFTTKVKDTCSHCRGKGEHMGLVCYSCKGSRLDELQHRRLVSAPACGARSAPSSGRGGSPSTADMNSPLPMAAAP